MKNRYLALAIFSRINGGGCGLILVVIPPTFTDSHILVAILLSVLLTEDLEMPKL
jgi:hypothetical protein